MMQDDDPQETAKWLDAMEDLIAREGPQRAEFLLTRLNERALDRGVRCAGLEAKKLEIGTSPSYSVLGSSTYTNEQLLANFPDRTSEDIFERTGIESRQWLGPEETPLTIAVDAARRALTGEDRVEHPHEAMPGSPHSRPAHAHSGGGCLGNGS
jgi:hypothetical protein